MTTPFLVGDLMGDEGLRRAAYRDGGGVWTIGYGHTGPEVRAGMVWRLGKIIDTLLEDIAIAQSELDDKLPWWRTLDDVRQDVMVELAFNLGIGGLLGFHQALAAIQAGRWAAAAGEMLASAWAGEVGARACRLAALMRNGSRAA